MIKDLNFYNQKIKEIRPDDSHIAKELIFYIKEKLGLNDLSIFIDNHKFSKEEENLINNFIEKKKKGGASTAPTPPHTPFPVGPCRGLQH